MNDLERAKLQHYNAILMCIEGAMFVIATSFMDASTVVAVFTNLKTGATTAAGIASALVFLAPLVGTTIMGNMVEHLKNHGRAMTLWGIFSRSMILPTMFALRLHLPDVWQAAIFVAGYGLFYFGDGFVSLVWTDILARTQPVKQRMVIHSIARIFGGIVGFIVALIVQRILNSDLSVDDRFSLIFGGACIGMVLNAICLGLIRDDPDRTYVEKPRTSWGDYFRSFPPLFKKNALVRRAICCKIFFHLSLMTIPLNILFCAKNGASESVVAALVFMPVIGTILGGFFWAFISKRFTYRVLMLVSQILSCIAAALSIIGLVLGASGVSVVLPMALVILVLAVNMNAKQGYEHYIISIVSEEDRAHYVVLCSIMTAPFTLGSVLAGLLVDTAGYPVVFILFACIAVIGLALTYHFFFGKNAVIAEEK